MGSLCGSNQDFNLEFLEVNVTSWLLRHPLSKAFEYKEVAIYLEYVLESIELIDQSLLRRTFMALPISSKLRKATPWRIKQTVDIDD